MVKTASWWRIPLLLTLFVLASSASFAQLLPKSHTGRLGTHLLWSASGVECVAGCNGLAEPINLRGGTNWDVDVTNFDFTPQNLNIAVGDSVTWTNVKGNHNVRADDDSFRCANGCDGDGGNGNPADNAWVVTLTFTEVATIPYYCEVHGGDGGAGMSGVVNVIEPIIFEDSFETGDTSEWDSSVTTPDGIE